MQEIAQAQEDHGLEEQPSKVRWVEAIEASEEAEHRDPILPKTSYLTKKSRR